MNKIPRILTYGIFAAILLMAGFFLRPAVAQASISGNWTYKILDEDNKTAELTGYKGSDTAIVIPESLDGYRIVAIGERALRGSSLTSVTIPAGVTTIGKYAFSTCKSLTSVTLSEDLKTIVTGAFYSCEALESITLPSGLQTIGEQAFYGCKALTTLTIPASVTSIGSQAFYSCEGLTSLTLSKGLSTIAEQTFYDCKSLTSVTIPAGVTTIGELAFSSCDSLESITFSKGLKTIGQYAFAHCENVLMKIVLPDGLTEICDYAFYACTHLADITFPDSLTDIGDKAFEETAWLSNRQKENPLVIVNGILVNARNAYGDVVIPEGVTCIGPYAFTLSQMTSLTIPDSVTRIQKGAFTSCWNLKEIVIPAGVTVLESNTFGACQALTSITLPDGLTAIGEQAFYCCDHLTSITIPESVTAIEEDAFRECTRLTEIIGYSDVVEECVQSLKDTYNYEVSYTGLSQISLKDKTVTFNGTTIAIETATVTGSTGKVTYAYYTDAACTKQTTTANGATAAGAAPRYAGTYYVKATVAASDPYLSATSEAAKLVINKAASTLALAAKTVTYNGTAVAIGAATVTGSTGKITYTYYTDAACTKQTTTANGATAAGAAPCYAGTYYVKAGLAADTNYKEATSGAAKLVINKAASTLSLTAKKVTYSGKRIAIGTAKKTGSTGKITYTYYTNSACTKKTTTANGAKAAGTAPKYAGTYYVKADLAADTNYQAAAGKAVKLTINKAKATIKIKVTSKTYKKATVKKKAQTFALGVSVTGKGKLSYKKVSGSKALTINKSTGKITLKKATKAGTYKIKIKITAKASKNYKAATKTLTIKVKVK